MAELDPAVVAAAFGGGRLPLAADGVLTRLRGLRLGEIDAPSGAIHAYEPFFPPGPETPPFETRIPPGAWPVDLAMAQIGLGHERVAMARLSWSDRPPVRWPIALLPGQAAQDLEEDEIFGYGVMGGTGGFIDAGVAAIWARRAAKEGDLFSELWINSKEPGLIVTLGDPLKSRFALFSSGWGDGFFASYFGLDRDGAPVALVTDFGLFDSERAEAQGEAGGALTPHQR